MRAARVWRLTSLSVSVVQAILRGENISAAPRRSRACNYRPNTKVSHRLLSSVSLKFDRISEPGQTGATDQEEFLCPEQHR